MFSFCPRVVLGVISVIYVLPCPNGYWSDHVTSQVPCVFLDALGRSIKMPLAVFRGQRSNNPDSSGRSESRSLGLLCKGFDLQ